MAEATKQGRYNPTLAAVPPSPTASTGIQMGCHPLQSASPPHQESSVQTGTHPTYVESSVRCSCGNAFTTRSTRPAIHLELCNECHPFFTGKHKQVDSGGRIARFERRYAKTGSARTRLPSAT